jgi:vacuolar-type H+-ATPase subunit E/Vma4
VFGGKSMDITKAVINVKEGIIELEGSQEFVEKYLNEYKQIITNLQTASKIEKTQRKVEKSTDKTQKKRTRTKTGPSCTQKVQELLDEGFFREPRDRSEVQQEILNRGLRFQSKEVSATLINAFNASKLKRTGAGKNAKYYSNV